MKTIINKNTGQVLYCSLSDVDLAENEIAIDNLLTETMVAPYWNFKDKVFYDNANQTQIDDSIKALVPNEVERWKIVAILQLTNNYQNIVDAINQLEEPTKTIALTHLENGESVVRTSQTVLFIQSVLQMTDEQVDEIFINANNINL